ncbi:Fur family transcriptional regulator [Azospirillum sp. SYSU D00513]|uniref:Fur family transcriptional regulator n=1 Tax=Azospirillum sp. SYSU D00513 TaxID=2812561 RepID=UPI0032B5F0AA
MMHSPHAPAPHHDHDHCIADALTRADALCAERGARLTSLRRRVLELVWNSHRPRGAYAILEDLSQQDGKPAAPLTVYRALEFLVEQGLVHRIESLNAYVGCAAPGAVHSGQFLVCAACGNAIEIDDPRIRSAIDATAAEHGFRVQRPTVEVRGLCPECQEKVP